MRKIAKAMAVVAAPMGACLLWVFMNEFRRCVVGAAIWTYFFGFRSGLIYLSASAASAWWCDFRILKRKGEIEWTRPQEQL